MNYQYWPWTLLYLVTQSAAIIATWQQTLSRIHRDSNSGRTTNEEKHNLNSVIQEFSLNYRSSRSLPVPTPFILSYESNFSHSDTANVTLSDGSITQSDNHTYIHHTNGNITSKQNFPGGIQLQADDFPLEDGSASTDYHRKIIAQRTSVQQHWWILSEVCVSSIAIATHCVWIFFSTVQLFPPTLNARKREILLKISRMNMLFEHEPRQLSSTVKHSPDKSLYYGLQLHVGFIGVLYALTVLIGKSFRFSITSPTKSGSTFKKATSHPWNTFQLICDITRTTSLILLTIYWLNFMFFCVLHLRFLKMLFRLPFVKSEQSRGDHFIYYFHFGASWIYAILLRSATLLFTNFPEMQIQTTTASKTLSSKTGVRILAIDCQLCWDRPPENMFSGAICSFSFVEFVLELVIVFLGDVAPCLAVCCVIVWICCSFSNNSKNLSFAEKVQIPEAQTLLTADGQKFKTSVCSQLVERGAHALTELNLAHKTLRSYILIFLFFITPVILTANVNHVTRMVNHILFVIHTLNTCNYPVQRGSSSHRHWPTHVNELIELIIVATIPVGIILTHWLSAKPNHIAFDTEAMELRESNRQVQQYSGNGPVSNTDFPSASSAITPTELLRLSTLSRAEFTLQQVSPTLKTNIQPDLCTQLCPPTNMSMCKTWKSNYVPISVQVVSLPTFCCQTCTVTVEQARVTPDTIGCQSFPSVDDPSSVVEASEKPLELYIISQAGISPSI